MTIDVRKEFDVCVRAMNGAVLDDVLKIPPFLNADYWFPEYRVVAEFKRLAENVTEKEDFKREISELYQSWIRKNLLSPSLHPNLLLDLRSIPQTCAYEYLEVLKKRLSLPR
jgi:hypothetical protein